MSSQISLSTQGQKTVCAFLELVPPLDLFSFLAKPSDPAIFDRADRRVHSPCSGQLIPDTVLSFSSALA
ncbi:hypothetical protein, partial [Pseudomonas lundensis]|uniref:hypothetical protein n=1 Tax=Pseudomonas lundensis TaxID=86185 RepID=UPI001D008775